MLEGLKHVLGKTDFQVMASGTTVDEVELRCADQHQSLMLILDAGHDLWSAIRQIELFKRQRPDGRVAVLVDTHQMAGMESVFQAGANACFPRAASAPTFLKSLELVMMGDTLLPSSVLPSSVLSLKTLPSSTWPSSTLPSSNGSSVQDREQAPTAARPASGSAAHLSAQEERILSGLVEGHPNKLIAKELDIAESTVKVHVKAILRKLGIHNRTQAAIWAMSRAGLDASMREVSPSPSPLPLPPPPRAAAESLAAPPSVHDQTPAEPPIAGNGSPGGVEEEMTTADTGEVDCSMHEDPPSPLPPLILAEVEQPLLAATPSTRHETPAGRPVAGSASLEDVGVKLAIADTGEVTPRATSRNGMAQLASVSRFERRIAEDEERRDAMLANVERLRALRNARDTGSR
ncbi:DNA-binding response regulator, NarL/FixJ family, contains REC and HTH domains [Rhizobiales bacterium GAS113]|nr:DNA-binding response regulator, NarL/FixJ family, contains REC and HTH domains [Rhizobiales bacterium GAS113]